MLRIAVFVSGGGTNLQNIIDGVKSGELAEVEIVRVISSKAGIGAERRALENGIPYSLFTRSSYTDSKAMNDAILRQLRQDKVDLIVLAGFLQKLSPELVRSYPERIINIHPALLPRHGGPGMYGIRPHEAVLAAGEKVTGATVHIVDEEYDRGRILLQQEVRVLPQDDARTLQQRVMEEAEKTILPRVIKDFARAKMRGLAPFEARE
ncbi:MAG TPA: phosphoribosylglycinamide formyltransferase [Clostridiaceae bacterium]|nr:phosphoribosylglycinamide formyltransferase [Clostridiaceae bacterium]